MGIRVAIVNYCLGEFFYVFPQGLPLFILLPYISPLKFWNVIADRVERIAFGGAEDWFPYSFLRSVGISRVIDSVPNYLIYEIQEAEILSENDGH